MQQADQRDSTAHPGFAAGKDDHVSGHTRRALFGAVAAAAVLAPVVPAVTQPSSSRLRAAVAASRAADARFEALPDHLETTDMASFRWEERRMSDTRDHALSQMPADWEEYVLLFELASDDGAWGLTDDMTVVLLGHARRLARAS